MRILICMVILMFSFLSINAQKSFVNWMSLNDIKDSMAIKQKPLLIKVETKWCGYCKKMEQGAFSYKKVVKELNQNYYCVKMDAESKSTLWFNDTSYQYVIRPGGRGINKLALKIAKNEKGNLQYPTTIIFNENYEKEKLLDGYLGKKSFWFWLKG